MDHTTIYPADLNSALRELFASDFGFVVALSARWQIDFACVYSRDPIQMYICKKGGLILTVLLRHRHRAPAAVSPCSLVQRDSHSP